MDGKECSSKREVMEKIYKFASGVIENVGNEFIPRPVFLNSSDQIGVDAVALADIAAQSEKILISEVPIGSVLFWSTDTKVYFFGVISHEECYEKGSAYVWDSVSNSAETIEDFDIMGASFGGMIFCKQIVKDWPVECYLGDVFCRTEEVRKIGWLK